MNLIRVLLVDDDEDEYVILRDLLSENRGIRYSIDWTDQFDDAKRQMVAQIHDVYLVDYRLGTRSGLELIREANQQGCRAPIILLTGFDDQDIDREAINLGAADYLRKGEISAYLMERSIRYAIYRNQMQAQAVSQDRMASIGLIASSLAHEIGTPLGVIRGRAEYLQMQAQDNPSLQKNLTIITTQIDRVSSLIRSLLNLASGDRSEQIVSTSVNKAISDVFDLMGHELKTHDIGVSNELGETILVRGQPQKLHQVLLNMVMNAVHAILAAQKAGIIRAHSISIGATEMGPQWAVTIRDTGCGISRDNLAQLFRPFFTTKGPGLGTGLGLATALWIVQSWGGSIEVESTEDEGTIFRIRIPRG